VRIAAEHGGWAIEVNFTGSKPDPSFEVLRDTPTHVATPGLRLVRGERVRLALLHAVWSYSPGGGRGVQDWPTVQADVSELRLCGRAFFVPNAPPAPPYAPLAFVLSATVDVANVSTSLTPLAASELEAAIAEAVGIPSHKVHVDVLLTSRLAVNASAHLPTSVGAFLAQLRAALCTTHRQLDASCSVELAPGRRRRLPQLTRVPYKHKGPHSHTGEAKDANDVDAVAAPVAVADSIEVLWTRSEGLAVAAPLLVGPGIESSQREPSSPSSLTSGGVRFATTELSRSRRVQWQLEHGGDESEAWKLLNSSTFLRDTAHGGALESALASVGLDVEEARRSMATAKTVYPPHPPPPPSPPPPLPPRQPPQPPQPPLKLAVLLPHPPPTVPSPTVPLPLTSSPSLRASAPHALPQLALAHAQSASPHAPAASTAASISAIGAADGKEPQAAAAAAAAAHTSATATLTALRVRGGGDVESEHSRVAIAALLVLVMTALFLAGGHCWKGCGRDRGLHGGRHTSTVQTVTKQWDKLPRRQVRDERGALQREHLLGDPIPHDEQHHAE